MNQKHTDRGAAPPSRPPGALAALVALAALLVAGAVSAQPPAGATIEILGGDGQRGAAGSLLGRSFRVRVVDAAGAPVAGAAVQWNVIFGDAELLSGGVTVSGPDGATSNRLRLGTRTGLVQVAVRVAGADRSEILSARIDADADPTRDAFDRACNDDLTRLAGVCAYVDRLSAEDQETVRAALEPNEISAQATLAQESARGHLDAIAGRLDGLGARGHGTVDHASIRLDRAADGGGAELDDGLETRSAHLDGQRHRDRRLGFFAVGSVGSADRPRVIEESGFDLDTYDLTVGVDYRFGRGTVLGLAAGLAEGDADLSQDGGELSVESEWLSLYLAHTWPSGFYGRLVAAFGADDHEITRTIDLPLAFRGRTRYLARGTTDGDQTAGLLEIGYTRRLVSRTVFTGFLKGHLVEIEIDPYTETGDADGAGLYLEILRQEIESTLVEAGVDLAWPIRRAWGLVTPRLRLALLSELDDQDRPIRARFAADDTAAPLVLPTAEPDESFVSAGAGVTFHFDGGADFYLEYETDLERADLEVEILRAGLVLAF